MYDISLSRRHHFCILRSVFPVMLLVLAACSADKVETPAIPAAAVNDTTYPTTETNNDSTPGQDSIPAIPVREFLTTLIKTTPAAGDAINGRINLPSIWVFSPQGDMTRVVSGMDELDSFAENFQSGDTKLSAITCKAVESAARAASKTEWDGGCGNRQWVALVLVNKDRLDTCATCQEYQAVLDQIRKKNADGFQTHVLPLDMN